MSSYCEYAFFDDIDFCGSLPFKEDCGVIRRDFEGFRDEMEEVQLLFRSVPQ